MITYKESVQVFLDGKYIGDIRTVSGGYQYFPKGKKVGGDIFPTLSACKYSLEA